MEFDLNKENVLDFEDLSGNRVIFNKKNYLTHLGKRPDTTLMADRIVDAINNPDVIYSSPVGKNRYCFYKLSHRVTRGDGSVKEERYVKVVVEVVQKVYIIITAFRPTSVKEEKYSKPCQKP